MTQEDKKLLLKDLCARLPYGVLCKTDNKILQLKDVYVDGAVGNEGQLRLSNCKYGGIYQSIDEVRPFLRPMSSMTENEKEEILTLFFGKDSRLFYINDSGVVNGKSTDFFGEGINNVLFSPENVSRYTDWLNKKMFDYRGLIPMGLSLEATDGMYNK